MKQTRLKHVLAALAIGSASGAASADCLQRLDEVRELQARTPMLDVQRPDLKQMRTVARDMAAHGNEALCMELATELEALVDSHRSHVGQVEKLANFATAVPISTKSGTLTSNRLVGMSVRNRVGEELGEVSGIAINAGTGKVAGLQVTAGGFLGIGEYQAGIAWPDVFLSIDGSAIVLDMTAEDLEKLAEVP